jgi:hypothetical protein
MDLHDILEADGTLPSYGWPGGYPILYLTTKADILCATCAKDNLDQGEDCPWPVVGWDIHYEGPSEYCANCNAEIESAYGDPDAKEEDKD